MFATDFRVHILYYDKGSVWLATGANLSSSIHCVRGLSRNIHIQNFFSTTRQPKKNGNNPVRNNSQLDLTSILKLYMRDLPHLDLQPQNKHHAIIIEGFHYITSRCQVAGYGSTNKHDITYCGDAISPIWRQWRSSFWIRRPASAMSLCISLRYFLSLCCQHGFSRCFIRWRHWFTWYFSAFLCEERQ